jgi:hypothetical protein
MDSNSQTRLAELEKKVKLTFSDAKQACEILLIDSARENKVDLQNIKQNNPDQYKATRSTCALFMLQMQKLLPK